MSCSPHSMERVVRLVCLTVCLCVVQAYALEDDDYRRALEALRVMSRASEQERRAIQIVSCVPEGDDCSIISNCCGDFQCYWEKGFSARTSGECVLCVNEGLKCQRDSQCCANLQCDKGNALWVDGTCQKYRRDGHCYRDGQCVTNCAKPWYMVSGKCE